MSKKLQPVRGTKDLLASEYRLFDHITQAAKRVCGYYGFEQIATPIFEFTDVFKRTLGEDSDVVGKEMYNFEDRNGESMTLRPEFTAGIARAFISNGLQQNIPLKLFSTGPVFRYERPQKGRQRQFHQVNFELLGVDNPIADVEVIAMGRQLVDELGVGEHIKLEINSLGDAESRKNYREALVKYFSSYEAKLSEDSKRRLKINPMRILDSKDDGDKAIVANAPVIDEHYSDKAKGFFDVVKSGLDSLGIKYEVNKRLVRGLDYYCHTAFEFTTDQLGSQNAVLAGGRYDGLMEIMGGPETPAVGFAGGIERLMALVELNQKDVLPCKRPVVLVPIGQDCEFKAVAIANDLRKKGLFVDFAYNGNVGKRMKKAGKMNASAAIIFGDDELANKKVKIKDFDSGVEKDVDIDNIFGELND
ncbi:histidine--tRNA ligase [Rickettsiales bacterium]|nr:histidine--tRNA ligase [Rickettsiales bacterium]